MEKVCRWITVYFFFVPLPNDLIHFLPFNWAQSVILHSKLWKIMWLGPIAMMMIAVSVIAVAIGKKSQQLTIVFTKWTWFFSFFFSFLNKQNIVQTAISAFLDVKQTIFGFGSFFLQFNVVFMPAFALKYFLVFNFRQISGSTLMHI